MCFVLFVFLFLSFHMWLTLRSLFPRLLYRWYRCCSFDLFFASSILLFELLHYKKLLFMNNVIILDPNHIIQLFTLSNFIFILFLLYIILYSLYIFI